MHDLPLVLVNSVYDGATTAHQDHQGGRLGADGPPGSSRRALTAGAAASGSAAPVVSHGWAAALTGEKAHWVPEGAPQNMHQRRPTGLALDGWYALIDEQGLRDGAGLPPCRTCCRALARLSAPSEGGRP